MISALRWLVPGLALGLLLGCENEARLPDFTGLVEDAAPAIVNISGTGEVAEGPGQPVPPLFEWFRDFVEPGEEEQKPRQQPHRSLGSGFILSEDGEILTNNHVIAEADEILVTLADQRQFKAKVIGRDKASDLALLRIEADDLPVLRFGDSDRLRVGEWVLAIGSPFGFEQTVTAGIVSGKRRALGSEQYVPFLQTDVAINPGNSGGPLFNLKGEVVGINSQIFSQTGGYMGLSFAIPSVTAANVIRQLREHGRVRRGWLGVVIQQVDGALAESFGLEHATGALVSHVESGGPADKAGLRSGDVILEVDGETVPGSAALPPMVGQRAPGETVRLSIMRDGKRTQLRVNLGEVPGEELASADEDWTGLSTQPLSERLKRQLNLEEGLLVRGVQPGSAAARAGLRQGDLILSWAGDALAEPADLERRAARLNPGQSAALLVLRNERTLFIALQRPATGD